MANGFGKLKPKTGNSDSARIDELIDMINFNDYADEYVDLRFLDKPIISVKQHWIKLYAGKEKKEVTVPRYCVAHNAEDENTPKEGVECPYCDIPHGKDKTASARFFYLANAIVREIQEDEPRKKAKPTKKELKSGFKEPGTKTWTPVRVVRIPSTLAARIQELGELNIVKKGGKKKAFDVSDNRYGVDVKVKYKPKAPGTDKYSADKDDERSPLTEEEKEYLCYNLCDALLDMAGRMSPDNAIEDLKRMSLVGAEDLDDDEDDGIDLGGKKKKGKKGKKKSKSAFEEDDDDLDEDEDEEDDDDEDEPPRRSKSKKKKSSKSKTKSKAKAKKKKRSYDDEDEDEKPKRSKKAKKKSSTKKSSAKKKKSKKKFEEDEEDDIPF